MGNNTYLALGVIVVAAVTALIRFAPFFLFREEEKTPKLVKRLGKLLPGAMIALLVVYCLKDVSFRGAEGWLPQLTAAAATVGLQCWRKNTLLSIAAGTGLYMLLVQFVFR